MIHQLKNIVCIKKSGLHNICNQLLWEKMFEEKKGVKIMRSKIEDHMQIFL